MQFIETPIFTSQVERLLSDEEYRGLQLALVLRPEQGAVIPGGGGVRKLRWRRRGAGKRTGVRVIYYWVTAEETIHVVRLPQDTAERSEQGAAQGPAPTR